VASQSEILSHSHWFRQGKGVPVDTLALNVALGTGIVADRLEEAERWGGLKRHGERWIVPGKTYKKMWKLMNLMKTVAFLGKGSTFMTFLVGQLHIIPHLCLFEGNNG